MLSERLSMDELKAALPVWGAWHPYPTAEEREPWLALPVPLRSHYVSLGEARLGYAWPALPATLFLEYARIGNRANFEAAHFARRGALCDLVLAECVEAEGRFLDDIANGIWAICEETYWGLPAHVNAQRAGVDLPDVEEPTVDLFAGETVALLAWIDYLLGERLDALSPLLRRRLAYEAQRRVLDPCLTRDDFWWMAFEPSVHGVNNWNPWVNSNWITAVLLLEPDQDRRAAALHKVLRSLDIFLGVYGEAGGCDEGPGYWGRAGASLFDCLDQFHSATGGQLDVYGEPKIQNMGRFIYRAHISDDYYVDFADASAINHPSAPLIYRYGVAIGDRAMQRFGAWLAQCQDVLHNGFGDSLSRQLPALFTVDALLAEPPAQPLPRDVWLDDIQVMVARDRAGSSEGLFLAAKAGHNAESHNHNDVGSFIVFAGGKPLIVDVGVETYTRKTFSPQRYEIWTMQSAYHTLLPTFDGVMQAPGRQFAASHVRYAVDDARAQLTLELAGAYPAEAHLRTWAREITLERGAGVTIRDAFALDRPVARIALSVLTPCSVRLIEGEVTFGQSSFAGDRQTGAGVLGYDAEVFGVYVEAIPITDARMGAVWGSQLQRVVFATRAPVQQGHWQWRLRA